MRAVEEPRPDPLPVIRPARLLIGPGLKAETGDWPVCGVQNGDAGDEFRITSAPAAFGKEAHSHSIT
jgi:hypothetical protein